MPPSLTALFRPAAVALLLVLAGCNAFRGAPPSTSPDLSSAGEAWSSMYGTNAIVACLAKQTEDEQKLCRNNIVQARLITIDNNFTVFRQAFYREARTGGFAATIAGLALNATGAVAGVSSATKSVLSGVAGAISGGREAFDKEVLIEQTATALERAMDAARAQVLARILPSLPKSTAEYPLMVAMNDLEAYYNAGTVLGGLISLNDTMVKKADQEDAKVALLRGLNTTPPAEFLSKFFMGKATPAERVAALKQVDAAIRQVAPAGTYDGDAVGWLRSPKTDPDQLAAVARKLGWTGPG